MDDDPDIVLVAYGSPSRVVLSAVKEARAQGIKAGAIRLQSLWPFQDSLFKAKTKYLVVELNYEGQLVKEVQRSSGEIEDVHFYGKCGELPSVAELIQAMKEILEDKKISFQQFKAEAW
jgi:2-oxoglutarate ferredoxin oxidoreductase subunit alpha